MLHPSQTREGPGSGGDHNPSQPRNQTRDLDRTRHQQLNAEGGQQGQRVGKGAIGEMGKDGRGKRKEWKIGIITRFNTPRQQGYVVKRYG